jgi:hypothetical protein
MSSAPAEILSNTGHPVRVRRMTVAGALDEGLRIVHDNYRELIQAALLFSLLPMFVSMYFGMAAAEEFNFGLAMFLEGQPVDLVPLLQRMAIVTLPLLTIAYRVVEPLCLGALVVLSAGVLTGHRTTIGSAMRSSLGCGFALVIMWTLRWLSVQLGTLFCYIPGILLAALFFSALPALVLERLGPLRALGRSVDLNSKRLWESVLLVLLLGLIDAFVISCAQLLPHGLLQSIGLTLLYSSTLVLYAAAVTAFYFSGRCQLENYDLQLWAQAVQRRDELLEHDETSRSDPPARV